MLAASCDSRSPRWKSSRPDRFSVSIFAVPSSSQVPARSCAGGGSAHARVRYATAASAAPRAADSHAASRSTPATQRSEEHTSELQSRGHLVCRLLLEKKKKNQSTE